MFTNSRFGLRVTYCCGRECLLMQFFSIQLLINIFSLRAILLRNLFFPLEFQRRLREITKQLNLNCLQDLSKQILARTQINYENISRFCHKQLKILWPHCERVVFASTHYCAINHFLCGDFLLNNLCHLTTKDSSQWRAWATNKKRFKSDLRWGIASTVEPNQRMKNVCKIQTRTIKKKFKNKFISFEKHNERLWYRFFYEIWTQQKETCCKIKNIFSFIVGFKMPWLRAKKKRSGGRERKQTKAKIKQKRWRRIFCG